MDDDPAKVRKLLRQQAAITGFGSFALRQNDPPSILTEAARVCAQGLDLPFCSVSRYRATGNDLLIEAGYGWQPGVVGRVVSGADVRSPQGRAFVTGAPSICNDLREAGDLRLPPVYAAHGVVSTIGVPIKGGDKPYGVLEIGDDAPHDYDQHEVEFLTGLAGILAEAIATSIRVNLLQTNLHRMRGLVEEKDRLLDEKTIYAEELQHRVRNNLQLVYGMLSKQVSETADRAGQRGIKAIARRVSSLAQVYDHLLNTKSAGTTDFGSFVKALCLNLAEIQAASNAVTLRCDAEPLILDVDMVTTLGIVVTELVTNSYDHAFPDGKGAAVVSVHRARGERDMATITVSDDGTGFKPKAESKRHGLRLVRRLIEQVRGTIMVDVDRGTVWTIRFPVAYATAALALT